VLKTDVDEQTKSRASIMPANVVELIPPKEFSDLLGYLTSLRETKSEK
jgi:hypothetical protein